MKCRLMLCGLFLVCVAILPRLIAQSPPEAKAKEKNEPVKTDITAEVREMNSDKFAAPPTQFRPGKVDSH